VLDGDWPALVAGRRSDVTIALENSPGYWAGPAICRDRGALAPRLRITYDVANALAIEDPAEGAAGGRAPRARARQRHLAEQVGRTTSVASARSTPAGAPSRKL
jgi:hypothetical protein